MVKRVTQIKNIQDSKKNYYHSLQESLTYVDLEETPRYFIRPSTKLKITEIKHCKHNVMFQY